MHRIIVTPGQIPQDTDVLNTNLFAMTGLGMALLDILGSQTFVAGLPCTQTTVASLAVLMGPGRIYSLQNVDNSAYGSIAANTAVQISKQGFQFGNVTLATAAPGTAGQSINYLIEAAYQDVDGAPLVLPFYNSANPTVAFSGPGNSGAPSNTQRQSTLVVQAKPGIPATTGSQTTPAPDSGFIGLYVVTVAYGQTTVTSSNISVYAGAPFQSGSYNGTLTGCTSSPTTPVKWYKNGNVVSAIITAITATSNTALCSITGMPANIIPITTQGVGAPAVYNNGAPAPGGISLDTSGNFNLLVNGATNGFATTNNKGLQYNTSVTWLIGV